MTLVMQDKLSLGRVANPSRWEDTDFSVVEVQSGPWRMGVFLCLPHEERRFIIDDSGEFVSWSNVPLGKPKPLKAGEQIAFTAIEDGKLLWGRVENLVCTLTPDTLRIVDGVDEVVWNGSYSQRHNSRHDNNGMLPREFDDQMWIEQFDPSSGWNRVYDQEGTWCRLANASAHH